MGLPRLGVGIETKQEHQIGIRLGRGFEVDQVAAAFGRIRTRQLDPVVGYGMEEGEPSLAVAVEGLEGLAQAEESSRLNAASGNAAEAYTLLNARVELQAAVNYAYGRNISDEVYFPELNGASRLVGAPATYGVGLRYSF